MPDYPLAPLLMLEGVRAAVDEARAACEELRWHEALRRRWAVTRTEAGVRAAHAGLAVDGVRVPLELVRDVARGAVAPPEGPEGDAVLGAVRVQAAVEARMAPPGSPQVDRMPFGQLLAHLHLAATGDDDAGRPREDDDEPHDLRGLGPAPAGPELAARLVGLGVLLGQPIPAHVPAVVLAAVVHAEILALRPFRRGNGAVARAMFRHLITSGGVDPVGVVVPDMRWASEPMLYLSTAARYATGTPGGVALWLRYCAGSVVTGAEQGRAIADAVVAGRLGPADDESDESGDGGPTEGGAPV